ncbi:hypothetical protein NZK35_06905 [Stieleria sp. ICT_E10.1]|uniref:Uncharacterized protein n=1 Tax=Stieleria magnilauensis TaxID=2527963 RepID=A0ABX5XTA1_9BACT|nr:hypothetical protein [Stieleria sedimenti]MCA9138832.1 hypothetical protein [Planctomycetales bacterium]MCS7466402.1 hypothetical protein [Stieleria sedimenti]QDV85245.1 hypothetical protein TBK1r_42240 [Planctomycetes bacterium TBK1r]
MKKFLNVDLRQAIDSSQAILEIRATLFALSLDDDDASDCVASMIERASKTITKAADPRIPNGWKAFIAGLRLLENSIRCQAMARSGVGDLIAETARTKFLVDEFSSKLSELDPGPVAKSDHSGASRLEDPSFLRELLLGISLPSLYLADEKDRERRDQSHEIGPEPKRPLVRVIAFLDDIPIATPQLLRSDLLYSIRFKIKGLEWPVDSKRVRLDLLTTCPQGEYSISEFISDQPPVDKNGGFEVELSGQIKFQSGQSSLLDDLVFAVQVAFESDDNHWTEVPAIGHTELRLKVTDESRQPLLVGNRSLDRHVNDLATSLISQCPAAKDELPELLPMLGALTRLLATYAQDAVFKGKASVLEADFQRLVKRDLTNILGQDVQQHVGQAGGFTDIRYRGVIVELKVESSNGDRDHLVDTYASQATQYTGAEARQVSILLVLDLTEKVQPPGDIRNDIRLFDVKTHGQNQGGFPAKAFLFVVNGNTRSPSSYSK